jgi:hypothetical protein
MGKQQDFHADEEHFPGKCSKANQIVSQHSNGTTAAMD